MFKTFPQKIFPKIFELFDGLIAINKVKSPKYISFFNLNKFFRGVIHYISKIFSKFENYKIDIIF